MVALVFLPIVVCYQIWSYYTFRKRLQFRGRGADPGGNGAGRHPDSDIFLDDVTVSRRHAEFRLESSEFQVVDVGSLNGTYVNREPVDSAVLANGDEVQIGKFRLVFLTGPKRTTTPA